MANIIRAYQNPALPENYFRAQLYVLRYCGIELVKDETVLYGIYSKVSIFLWIYLYTFLELYEIYAAWGGDMSTLTSIIMYCMTHVNGTLKVTTLFVTRYKYKRMMKLFHEGLFKPDMSRGGLEEFKHVRNVIKKTDNMLILFSTCVVLVIGSCICDSFVRLLTKPRNEWKMTFLPITIIDTTYSPRFEIGFVCQIIAMIMAALTIVSTDSLTTTVIAHLSGQFKILKTAFRNAKNRVIALKESSEGRNKTFDQCFEIVVRDSIKHHLLILDLGLEMEELSNLTMLFVFLFSILQLCVMLFQASLVPIGSGQFIINVLYWIDITVQVFMYCFFVDEVSSESVNVINAVMEMDWTGAPISVQKSMILIMGRAVRPVQLTAAKFMPVSLESFMSIVKASFSYFMVLRQVNVEE